MLIKSSSVSAIDSISSLRIPSALESSFAGISEISGLLVPLKVSIFIDKISITWLNPLPGFTGY